LTFQLPPLGWALILAALVVGILAGHFGWGRRWPRVGAGRHADYLSGLQYLINEQPDRALDAFLRLLDANVDTVETHFALGSLYRRRGEVERAIRLHRNLLSRDGLSPDHRDQAMLALAQDYLHAGLLDRAERLFQQIGEVPRLRVTALEALRGIYERQRDWRQALATVRELQGGPSPVPRTVGAHYLCELAAIAAERGDREDARRLLREARQEAARFPRAAVLRAQIAERDGQPELALRLMQWAVHELPALLPDRLPHLLRLAGDGGREALLEQFVRRARAGDFAQLKRLLYAALPAGLAGSKALRPAIESVFDQDPTLREVVRVAGAAPLERIAGEFGALLARADSYRCEGCGLAGRTHYWQCPGCQSWDSFETCIMLELR
jgi:lipopolysaccharide biosynthesis regulator YciM